MKPHNYDVLIIGSGIAGLSAATRLAESGSKVAILTREEDPHISNSFYAQGGIVYLKSDDLIGADIQSASSQTSSEEAIKVFQEKSGRILEEILLDKAKTSFEKNSDGYLDFTKEAAHSKSRILFRGDFTGKEIQISLLNYLKDKERFPNVSILTSHTAIDLLSPTHHGNRFHHRYEEQKICGAYVLNQKEEKVIKVLAKVTILATGGIGSMYLHHSNSEGARGDGHAMAKRAGAKLTNMEFIQFHPTTFYDRSSHRRFLVSEAIRGEGGVLLNSEGVAFMGNYHPDKEMAPRDVVSRSIDQEMIRTKHECVYLDISHKDADWIKKRFPTIYQHCLNNDVDITSMAIPVVPAAHYSCGGVKTNVKGETTLKGLYAVGEVACTGLHGANRLASTSLAEGLSWGAIAAEHILGSVAEIPLFFAEDLQDWIQGTEPVDPALVHQDLLTLKQTMWNYVGLTRSSKRLSRANAMFRELYDEIQKFYKDARLRDDLIGLRNSVEVAYQVLNASRRNKESIGCFYRIN